MYAQTCNFDALYAYLSTSNYDFNYDRAKNLRPKRNIKTAMNHGAPALRLVTPLRLGEPRTPGLSLATTMAPKRRSPTKVPVVGSLTINRLMTRVIGKVLTKAKERREMREKREADPEHYQKVNQKAQAKFYKENREKVLKWNREQRAEKYDRHLERTRDRRKDRRLSDQEFVIKDRMRSRLRNALLRQGVDKTIATFETVGCSGSLLMQHLNLSDGDEVDHIFPFELYLLVEEDQQRKVGNYKNLQGLTPCENNNKSDKLPTKAMAAKVPRELWPDGITMDMLPDIYPGWRTPLRM